MESRKAWRNRDPAANEAVLALLEALRTGLGAETVGLFDDDRGDTPGGADAAGLNFWDAFAGNPCGHIDWQTWYRSLRLHQRAEHPCSCGAGHRLHGFLIHARWALLLIAPPSLAGIGAGAIASSLTALAGMLPPARSAEEREAAARYEGDAPMRDTSRATWWVRKLPQ